MLLEAITFYTDRTMWTVFCSGIPSIKWVGGGESDIESAAQRSNPSRLPRNDSSDGDGNSEG